MASSYTLRRMYSLSLISVKAYTMESVPRSAPNPDLTPLFAALADRTRLRLLNLMNGREVCVCYFVEILRQSQPKISRHLAYLRRAGIVSARREGKWMHYSIERPTEPGALAILDATLSSFSADREMQSDLARLSKACCQPRSFVTLQGAPLPTPLAGETA
jgi:ArsR family transcriptional regulator, arsenate/arsenite/antimonite-responsive transcriptional repressor